MGLKCASGGWRIGGSEGWFGPVSGLFAGVRFCDASAGAVMCERWLAHLAVDRRWDGYVRVVAGTLARR